MRSKLKADSMNRLTTNHPTCHSKIDEALAHRVGQAKPAGSSVRRQSLGTRMNEGTRPRSAATYSNVGQTTSPRAWASVFS